MRKLKSKKFAKKIFVRFRCCREHDHCADNLVFGQCKVAHQKIKNYMKKKCKKIVKFKEVFQSTAFYMKRPVLEIVVRWKTYNLEDKKLLKQRLDPEILKNCFLLSILCGTMLKN